MNKIEIEIHSEFGFSLYPFELRTFIKGSTFYKSISILLKDLLDKHHINVKNMAIGIYINKQDNFIITIE